MREIIFNDIKVEKQRTLDVMIISHSNKKKFLDLEISKGYNTITELFKNLRNTIAHDRENEYKYVKEFMVRNGLNDKKYFLQKRIKNFVDFLFSREFRINFSDDIIQIIKNCTCYESPNIDNKSSILPNINTNKSSEYDDFYFNNLQTKLTEKVNRKIRLEFSNPSVLIENLESEIKNMESPKLYHYKKNIDKRYNHTLDLGISNHERKEKLGVLRKNNKLLEYIIWQNYKKESEV